MTKIELIRAFNFYSAIDADLKKTYFLEYTEKHGLIDIDTRRAVSAHVDAYKFSTAGALARLKMRGARLTQAANDVLNRFTKSLIEKYKTDDATSDQKTEPQPDSASKLKLASDARMSTILTMVDNCIDEILNKGKTKQIDLAQKMVDTRLRVNEIQELFDHITLEKKRISDDLKSDEPVYRAGKKIIKFYEYCETQIKRGETLQKTIKPRKQRAKKVKTTDQLVALLPYKDIDTDLNLKSANPDKIIGAQAVAFYDTEKRLLGIYHATDKEKGLSVYRTSIAGYDKDKSIMKTLRKPDEQIRHFFSFRYTRATKFIKDDIRAKAKPALTRLNRNVIILKIF